MAGTEGRVVENPGDLIARVGRLEEIGDVMWVVFAAWSRALVEEVAEVADEVGISLDEDRVMLRYHAILGDYGYDTIDDDLTEFLDSVEPADDADGDDQTAS
ncbi:MAG: hypothetical protein RIE08_09135 [Acidimicrobiales bacterium]